MEGQQSIQDGPEKTGLEILPEGSKMPDTADGVRTTSAGTLTQFFSAKYCVMLHRKVFYCKS